MVLHLTPSSPWLTEKLPTRGQLRRDLRSASSIPLPASTLMFKLIDLSYPALVILVAACDQQAKGFNPLTFAMINEAYELQCRVLRTLPIEVGGKAVGLLKCNPEVLLSVSLGFHLLESF